MKPILRQACPKPIAGNNQYPGELIEVVNCLGEHSFVIYGEHHGFKVVDFCVVIDVSLGIFAREQSCDTIFLERDNTKSGMVFRESLIIS